MKEKIFESEGNIKMPLKDRTNIKYGKLLAIAYKGNSKWLCQCDCGTQKIIYGGHLENGHTKSCGCIRPPRTKLWGQVFGRLTVLDWEGNGKWRCRCECGNEILVQTDNLKSGNTKSCGCLQKDRASEASLISLIGNRYGKLVVLERVENNRFGHVCYRCKCDCGGEAIVDAGNLRQGITNSCGCIKSKGEMIINNWLQEHNIDFRSQYSFEGCVMSTGRRPFFDFVLFKNNKPYFVIEYNGRPHYEATSGWNTEENVQVTQRRDREKLQWCEDNHYPVLIIKYDEDIEKILEERLL